MDWFTPGVMAAAQVQPPARGTARPTYAIAYVFSDPDQALPIFESIAHPVPPVLDPPAAPAPPQPPPQVIEASSRNETPEPPVPAPAPDPAVPQEEQAAPPAPAPQPQEGAAAQQEGGEQPVRQPLPRGEAERRALAYLAAHPDEELTPGQIAKAIDARGCRDLMARLFASGRAQRTSVKPLKYKAAPPLPQ